MPTTDRKLRVFLCHASQDKAIVRELYQRLLAEGWIDPWLDEEKLLPGQDWNMEIEKSVEATDAVILCLSKGALRKEGYFQKEVKKVLDISDEKPEGAIFIIPLRLDECEPPRRLAKWQYVDYFKNEYRSKAFLRVLKSLHSRKKSLGIIVDIEGPEVSGADIVNKSNSSSHENDIHIQKPVVRVIGNKKRNKKKNINKLGNIAFINQMEFIKIDAGKFILGSDRKYEQSRDDERPQQVTNILYDYWIGRYPVTVERFADFVDWSGYPFVWYKGREGKDDHPVKSIAFKDAQAFVKWLNKKHKNDLPESYVFRLPTEFEWEKAARGVDGREWPWGNEFDETRCNTLESKKGGTSPVGSYSPQGDSPFGIADMAGNVLEWTQSLYLPYRILKPKKIQKSKTFVLRGGSYFQGSKSARCASRYDKGISSYKWIGGYGFRVVIAPSDYF